MLVKFLFLFLVIFSTLVVCLFKFGFLLYNFDVHNCITPNSTEGLCVKLKDCPKLQPLFDEITTENYIFLRRSQCGYIDEPEVCCPTTGARKKFVITEEPPVRVPHVELFNRFGGPPKDLPEPGVCGTQTYDNKIFGGEITGIDEFPWMALLDYGRKNVYGNGFACGGALIHSRYVLTAAHCCTGQTEKDLGGLQSVRLGEHNIESAIDCDAIAPSDCAPKPIDMKIVKKIIHPDYRPNTPDQHNDIALLKLADDVEFNDFVTPVCLTKNITGGLFTSGKVHYVCGWGLTEQNRNSPIKLKLKIQIAETKSCSNTYTNRFKIRLGNKQICAGGSGTKDSCRGDSGGPLMVPANIPGMGPTWFMTGIVSIGPTPCATRNVPGIYTKVSDYYDWIVANME